MKLSPTQQKVVDTLRAHPGAPLVRIPGGFWTYKGCPLDERSYPVWSVAVGTVRAMEQRGLLRRLNVYSEDWRDDRALVEQ